MSSKLKLLVKKVHKKKNIITGIYTIGEDPNEFELRLDSHAELENVKKGSTILGYIKPHMEGELTLASQFKVKLIEVEVK